MLLCTWLCDKCYLTSVPKTWSQGWTGQERHLAFNLGEGLGLPCREGKPQEDHPWEDTEQAPSVSTWVPAPSSAACTGIPSPVLREDPFPPLFTAPAHPSSIPLSQNSTIYCFLFVSKFNFFNWRIIALQNCVFSAKHQHDSAIPIPPPARLLQSPSLSFLSPTANSHWLSILYMVISTMYFWFNTNV